MSEQEKVERDEQSILFVDVIEEMKKSYLDYSMSVIVGRALPDVRDGLKPVHRRILHAMNELGFSHDKAHRKSARIVGEVIGKYHPHGDPSIYGALVRFAQDFNMRYPLVDGHGNFGSIDGDGAAAMRYTEARMAKITQYLLKDIEKETVDFVPNFDETEKQPVVMPARFPNLLVNGSNGIAVGMATSIPPHNLSEIIDAIVHLIDHPDAEVEELMDYVKGPDFPTGGEIIGVEGMKSAYRTGRGKVVIRSVTNIEELKNGKYQIVVTEIPFQTNKAKLVEEIAALVKDKRIDGITALRDESSREGIRIVIELRRDVTPSVIQNQLFKMSQLQSSFGIILLALDNGEPRVMTLREILDAYIAHQEQVETRRVQFDLKKALERIHILEGLRIAIDNIDEVIRIIRAAYNDAEQKLMEAFSLSEIQAKAIVDMRLRRLQGLEREKIEEEYQSLMKLAESLRAILADRDLLMDIIKQDLMQLRTDFDDPRRTKISFDENEINIEDLIEEDRVVITLTHAGYMKRVSTSEYTAQKRGGRGKTGLSTREEDFVKEIYTTSTHDTLLFFTNFGKVYKLKAYQIPDASRTAKGTAIINLLPLSPDERIASLIPVSDFESGYIALCTKAGTIKKIALSHFVHIRKNGKNAIHIHEGDELISVRRTGGDDELFIVTRNGKAIRFSESDVRPMGTTAAGVRAIRLSKIDEVVAMDVYSEGGTLLVITENGYGKRTDMSSYTLQRRGGSGLITYKFTSKSGFLIGARNVSDQDDLMIINSDGVLIRISISDISVLSRNTSGVRVMKLEDGIKLVSLAKIADAGESTEEISEGE
ncbi:MAG: DNA gyrase subunit A [Bacillota bacterium]|nr:DNA gyrase subunit A [Bacillota bacterium]